MKYRTHYPQWQVFLCSCNLISSSIATLYPVLSAKQTNIQTRPQRNSHVQMIISNNNMDIPISFYTMLFCFDQPISSLWSGRAEMLSKWGSTAMQQKGLCIRVIWCWDSFVGDNHSVGKVLISLFFVVCFRITFALELLAPQVRTSLPLVSND